METTRHKTHWLSGRLLPGILAVLSIFVPAAPSWAANTYTLSITKNPILSSAAGGDTSTVTLTCEGNCSKNLDLKSTNQSVLPDSSITEESDNKTTAVYTIDTTSNGNAGTTTLEGWYNNGSVVTLDLMIKDTILVFDVSDTSLYEDGDTTSATITCTGSCGGNIGLVSDDTSIVSVSETADSGTTATYTLTTDTVGTATLNAQYNSVNNDVTEDITVSANTYTLTVADNPIMSGGGTTTATLKCFGNCGKELSLASSNTTIIPTIVEETDTGATATYTVTGGTAGTATLQGSYDGTQKVTSDLTVQDTVFTIALTYDEILENGTTTTATMTCSGTGCNASSDFGLAYTSSDGGTVTISEDSDDGFTAVYTVTSGEKGTITLDAQYDTVSQVTTDLIVYSLSPEVDGKLDDLYLKYGKLTLYSDGAEYEPLVSKQDIADNLGVADIPAAVMYEYEDEDYIYIYYYQDKYYQNDTSYGANDNLIHWESKGGGGRSLYDIYESDKGQFIFTDGDGGVVAYFDTDQLKNNVSGTPSGYGCAGFADVDGAWLGGTLDAIHRDGVDDPDNPDDDEYIQITSTMDYNFNLTGYCSGGACSCGSGATQVDLLTQSPIPIQVDGENNYGVADPGCSDWIWENGWEIRVDKRAFGLLGYGTTIGGHHNSPTKTCQDKLSCFPDLYFGVSSIGDRVWYDMNGNGLQDAGETGLQGVTVNLYDVRDDSILATTQTGANGMYLFEYLANEYYIVQVDESTLPAGFVSTTNNSLPADYYHSSYVNDEESPGVPCELDADSYCVARGGGTYDKIYYIDLDHNEFYHAADFGYMPSGGTIGDYVWSDANNNGLQNSGEPGIGGVTIELTLPGDDSILGTADDTTQTTTTDDSGVYYFLGLSAGEYSVNVTDTDGVLTGYTKTSGPQSKDDPLTILLDEDEQYMTADFGYHNANLGTIGDYVWIDSNNNGRYWIDVDEILEDPVVNRVHDWVDLDGDGQVDSSSDYWNDANNNGQINPGEVETGVDVDGDGIIQADEEELLEGESGKQNVTVDLYLDNNSNKVLDDADSLIAQAVTDATGAYQFTGLDVGADSTGVDYLVKVSDVNGVLTGFGITSYDFTLNRYNDPYPVNLAPGVDNNSDYTADFGYNGAGMIGDLVWLDANQNGVVDNGERGVGGITLSLEYHNGSDWVAVEDDGVAVTFTSNPDGSYLFTKLDTSVDYRVVMTGYTDNYTLSCKTGDPCTEYHTPATTGTINFGDANDSYLDADFALYQDTYTIGDFVWADNNGNGIHDTGELGIENVTLALYQDDDADGIIDSTESAIAWDTTDANGAYLFSNLLNGASYIVTVTDGYSILQGATLTTSNQPDPYTISGADVTTADFGYLLWEPASVGDYVWFDVDDDGVQDVGEAGLANVTVTLYLDDDGTPGESVGDTVVASTVTASDGNYIFGDLGPGHYYVRVDESTLPGSPGDLVASSGTTNPTAVFELSEREQYMDADFGYANAAAGTAVIGDFVWADPDTDGIQDPGEPGISNVTLELRPATGGAAIDTVTTAADGSYYFINVPAGEYIVEVTDDNTVLTGYTLTNGPQSSNNPTLPIAVAAGDVYLNADFGYDSPTLYSITDKVWYDANADRSDTGESGISDVTIALYQDSDNDDVLDSGEPLISTLISDSNGDFSFTGLPNGDYLVVITDETNELAMYQSTTAAAANSLLAVTIADADESGVNFGYLYEGAIGDFVWSDADGDSVQDAGESGIAGVSVELWLDADNDDVFDDTQDLLVKTATTSDTGEYLFTGWSLDRTYFVSIDETQSALSGYSNTTPEPDQETGANADGRQIEVTLSSSGMRSYLEADFGYQQPSLPDISGLVWEDLDEDAFDDGAGEPRFSGVTIGLFGNFNVEVATTNTDANGEYAFLDVKAGDYTVRVTDNNGVLTGYHLTSGLDAIPVTVDTSDVSDIDFGYVRIPATASIGDYVWLDADQDNVQDAGENGLSGVTLNLYSDDGDGTLDTGLDTLVATTSTDTNGAYLFSALATGNYFVDVLDSSIPAGLTTTTGTTDPFGVINLSSGESYLAADFGYASGVNSAIGDWVWYDANSDGTQDAGEMGISGVNVVVTPPAGIDIGAGNSMPMTITTDNTGFWMKTNLPDGAYTVAVDTSTLPSGYNTTPTNGNISRTVTLDGTGDIWVLDFGFDGGTPGSIGDTVFLDANSDTIQNNGDPGLSNVTLNLLDSAGNILASTTTDANGEYNFVGLPAGNYQVTITDVNGVLASMNLTGGSDPFDVALGAAEDYDDADFPYNSGSGSGVIGNQVWHDIGNDGIRDAGEPGIEGVVIDLWLDLNSNGAIDSGIDNLLRTEVTDSNGNYLFSGLPSGDYVVDVSDSGNNPAILDGFNLKTGTAGSDNNGQSAPYAVELTDVSPTNYTADFGYYAPAPYPLSGTVFHDVNGNHTFDDGIDGVVENALLSLYRDLDGDGEIDANDPLFGTVTTDSNGDYSFTGLADGAYILEVDPSGTSVDGLSQITQTTTFSVEPAHTTSGDDATGNDFGFGETPTVVVVASFRAYSPGDGTVIVEWTTVSEVGTAGFYIARLDEATGTYQRVGDSMVPALLSALPGGTYRVLDSEAQPDSQYTYQLIELTLDGDEKAYGPYSVLVENMPGAKSVGVDGFERVAHPRTDSEEARTRALKARQIVTSRLRTYRQWSQDVKIIITDSGLYYVDALKLTDQLGLSLQQARKLVKTAGLSLTSQGNEIAWWPADNENGLYFYGEALPENPYSADNVYWLSVGQGRHMEIVTGDGPAPSDLPHTFTETFHVEENNWALLSAYDELADDYFIWNYLFAGYPGYSKQRFPFTLHGVSSEGQGELTVFLKGGSATPAVLDHHAMFSLNGTALGETSWDDTEAHTFTLSFNQNLLLEGENILEIESGQEATLYALALVNSFDVTFQREYQAMENQLIVQGEEHSVVTVTDINAPDLAVFDITDPAHAKIMAAVTKDSEQQTLSFRSSASEAVYAVLPLASAVSPEVMFADEASSLKGERIGADYVVITPLELKEAAQTLADYRQTQGLETMVVDVEDIYDEYNYGISSPEAIKDFLTYAYCNWKIAPRYVVLAGEGNYDYKNYGGFNDNLVPPLLVSTPYGLYPSDNQFGDIVGNDFVPEIAVGRLPVVTDKELYALIDKIKAYENTLSADWRGNMMMVSDNPDIAGDFYNDSLEIADEFIPSTYSVDQFSLATSPIAELRQQVLSGIDSGALFLNYIGHGGMSQLAAEAILHINHVDSLNNGDRLPIMTALTCSVGMFGLSGYDSLSETLVLKPDGGMIAVWAPTGLSLNSEAIVLNRALFQAAFTQGEFIFGDMVLSAFREYAAQDRIEFLLKIYSLLGDPALRVFPGAYSLQDNRTLSACQGEVAPENDAIVVWKTGSGTGTIMTDSVICGAECQTLTIPYGKDGFAWVEAFPAEDSYFAGWRDLNGYLIESLHYLVRPGDVVEAVFEKY